MNKKLYTRNKLYTTALRVFQSLTSEQSSMLKTISEFAPYKRKEAFKKWFDKTYPK